MLALLDPEGKEPEVIGPLVREQHECRAAIRPRFGEQVVQERPDRPRRDRDCQQGDETRDDTYRALRSGALAVAKSSENLREKLSAGFLKQRHLSTPRPFASLRPFSPPQPRARAGGIPPLAARRGRWRPRRRGDARHLLEA
jgi:hypothetical protein